MTSIIICGSFKKSVSIYIDADQLIRCCVFKSTKRLDDFRAMWQIVPLFTDAK